MTISNINPVVTAPVLIPYTPDCEYKYGEEILPPAKIKHLANTFHNYQIIDLQHEYTKRLLNKQKPIERGKLIHSYISTDDVYLTGLDGIARRYPKGTWIITVEITDPLAVKLYNNGELTGFSITVKEKEHADAIIEYVSQKTLTQLPPNVIQSEKDFIKTPKRILMKDVKNPVAFTVSLVKQPCVYGAKFCRKSCVINNQNKLKENNDIVSLKEKIKAEINNFIDGLDVDSYSESEKEDISTSNDENNNNDTNLNEEQTESKKETLDDSIIETETEKSEPTSEDTTIKEIYGRKIKIESQKEEKILPPSTPEDEENPEDGEKPEDIPESEKDDPIIECTKCGGKHRQSEKCNGPKTKSATKSEDKSETVEYLSAEGVKELVKTTLQKYGDEVEKMVFDGIQEALEDYHFPEAMKSDTTSEEVTETEVETEVDELVDESVEAQKNYATPEMVESIFEEQFETFKSELMGNIKKAQSESIKSYSKAITPTDDGLKEEPVKEVEKPVSAILMGS